MKNHIPKAGVLLVGLVAATTILTGCATEGATNSDHLLTISRETGATFTRNFNPLSPNSLPITTQAIYEPLLIVNSANGETVPWLSTEWSTPDDASGVTFTVRDGVKWSDGEDFTADDVAFTFNLQLEQGAFPYVDTVTADGSDVAVTFSAPFSLGLYELGQIPILPEHIWADIDEPAKFTNETPVGTGPYTEVSNFQGQSFDLLPNPNYWQPDKQQIPGIRMLAYAGNDAAAVAAVSGEIDWIPQFIPDIQKVFVDKDPEHRGFWFPTTGNTIQWTLNTEVAPFDDVAVRKALSMGVDRQQIADVAMATYTKPADCTGLSDAAETWKDKSIVDACDWTNLDVDAANKALDDAGYARGADGMRTLKDGSTPFSFPIIVNATSSDWVSAAQIISKNMEDLGVDAKVEAQETNLLVENFFTGNFSSGIAWSGIGPTPYSYYRSQLSTQMMDDTGRTTENFQRYNNDEAKQLLADFVATTDEGTQKEISNKLQAIYNDEAPAIPLFPSPVWGSYNDTYFTGWPSADDPYADLSPFSSTSVVVLTTLKPR